MKAFVYKAPQLKKMHKETKFEQEKDRKRSIFAPNYNNNHTSRRTKTSRIVQVDKPHPVSLHDAACKETAPAEPYSCHTFTNVLQ